MNLFIIDWLIVITVPILAYFIATINRQGKNVKSSSSLETWRGYYLANGLLSPFSAGATYIGANLTFTSIFLILSEESYKRGYWTISIPVFWIIGTGVFIWLYPRMKKYTSQGMTLHQTIGSVFDSHTIQKYASLWTIIAFVGTVALEFYGGIKLLKAAGMPTLANFSIALILSGVVTAFTIKGGFRGVANSDIFLDTILLLGTFVLFLGLINYGGTIIFQPNQTKIIFGTPPEMPAYSENLIFVFGMALIFIPFQLCTLDSWQRVAAMEKQNKSPNSFLIIGTIVLLFAYLVPIYIGSYLRQLNVIIPKDSFVLFEYIRYMQIQPIFIGIVLAGFIAAIFSTADELLNCCSLSFLFDTLNISRTIDKDEKNNKIVGDSGKFYTGLFGLLAALFAVLFATLTFEFNKDISDLALAVFSGQIVFTIPLFYIFFKPSKAPQFSKVVIISMGLSFATSILCVIIGWINNDKSMSDGAPLYGFIIALLFLVVAINVKSFKYINLGK